ncbi:MAG TPA: hypothetical protein VGJ10_23875, partial [Paraburkholderia sp.]
RVRGKSLALETRGPATEVSADDPVQDHHHHAGLLSPQAPPEGWRAFLVLDGTTLHHPMFQAQPFAPISGAGATNGSWPTPPQDYASRGSWRVSHIAGNRRDREKPPEKPV